MRPQQQFDLALSFLICQLADWLTRNDPNGSHQIASQIYLEFSTLDNKTLLK